MYGKAIGLPIITNTEPRSLSYFKYAKNAMKVGDLNPNYSAVQMPYHPYHLPSNTDPLYKSQELLNNPNLGKHPYLNTYPLPPIGRNKENNLKEIKSGEIVDFPDETYIPLSQFVDYKNKKEMEIKINKEKEKAKEEEKLRIEIYGLNGEKKPSGASDLRLFHKKNLKHWRFMKNSANIICGYLRMKQLAFGHKNLHAKRFVLLQSAKEGMAAIREFLLPILSNIEDFCVEFFKSTIIFNANNKEKLERSIFVTKSFIHQLFSDFTSALAKRDDIPIDVKKIINLYTNDGSLLPYGFLSTFEFNRLEFTTDGLLTNMDLDRKGMLVCFIVLYRVLLVDILKRYLFYFKKVRDMDVDELDLLEVYERKLDDYEEKNRQKMMKNKMFNMQRGKMPGINEEESEEDDDEKEKKLFERDEKEENEHIEKEKNENKKNKNGTKNANPPKKKNNIEESDSDSDSDSESYDDDDDEDEEDEEEEDDESKTKTKKSKTSDNKKSKSDKKSGSKTDKKSENKTDKKSESKTDKKSGSKTDKKSSKNKSEQNKTKSSKVTKSKKRKDSKTSGTKKSENKENSSKNKLEGKEYGYTGYLDKKKGKDYHKKGIYFDDDREKGVPKDLIKEEERQREEKLKEKLEESSSSKSSFDEEDELSDSKKEKKSQNSKSLKSSQQSKTKSSKTNSKISKIDKSSSQNSKKPKNINEEFWGLDLEKKEVEELNKNRKPVKVQLDPLEQRKERIKKLPKEMRIKILEEERSKLNLKVKHNFHVISNILHSILKSAMSEYVPLYSEYYKEKFLYKDLVFQKTHQQYANGNDEIELSKGIIIDEETTEVFLTKNQRWAQMYKLLVFQFCRDFAEKCKL